ncbi:MAG: hypothetical protein AB8C84_05110 [Oligoflexales bacterium]
MTEQDPYEFFEGPLCNCLDDAYRFSSLLLLDTAAGQQVVQKAYHELGHGSVQAVHEHKEILKSVLKVCWSYAKKEKSKDSLSSHQWMKGLTQLSRASLICTDLLGLSVDDLRVLTGHSVGEISEELGQARKALLIHEQEPGENHSDDAIDVLADLEGLLDEDVGRTEAEQKCGSAEELEALLEDYQVARGRFQMSLHPFMLEENERVSIQELVRGHEKRLEQESEAIDSISLKEKIFFWGGRLVGALLLCGLAYGAYQKWFVEEFEFDAVQALAYEALMLEESEDIDFPATRTSEVGDYFAANHSVDFQVTPFQYPPRGWRVEGASVIDYEITQIAVTWFKRGYERLFHFVFPSRIASLENSKLQESEGFHFYSYASDQINLIVWEQNEGVFAMLAGRESVENLIAYVTQGKKEEGRDEIQK